MRHALWVAWAGCTLSEADFATAYERESCWYLHQCERDALSPDLSACTDEVEVRAEALLDATSTCAYDAAAARGCLAWMHKLVDSCADRTVTATAERCDVVWTCAEGGEPGVP